MVDALRRFTGSLVFVMATVQSHLVSVVCFKIIKPVYLGAFAETPLLVN